MFSNNELLQYVGQRLCRDGYMDECFDWYNKKGRY